MLIGPDGGDLPRGPDGRALIADSRNDENMVIAQLHLAFLKFHNAMVDRAMNFEDAPGCFSSTRMEFGGPAGLRRLTPSRSQISCAPLASCPSSRDGVRVRGRVSYSSADSCLKIPTAKAKA